MFYLTYKVFWLGYNILNWKKKDQSENYWFLISNTLKTLANNCFVWRPSDEISWSYFGTFGDSTWDSLGMSITLWLNDYWLMWLSLVILPSWHQDLKHKSSDTGPTLLHFASAGCIPAVISIYHCRAVGLKISFL